MAGRSLSRRSTMPFWSVPPTIPFEGSPEKARATDAELRYLLDAVNSILPEVRLDWSDIDFHCSAVRPLPHVDRGHDRRHHPAARLDQERVGGRAAVLDRGGQTDHDAFPGRKYGCHGARAGWAAR